MNNYDTSSTGENIDISVFYDYDQASSIYNDFELEATRINFGRESSIFILGDTTKPNYTLTELNKMPKDKLIELDQQYELLCPNDYDDYKKSDLIAELKKVTIARYYEYLAANYNWSNFGDNILHNYYISRGYSQGDAVYIISLDDELTTGYRKSIDHILWDSPVCLRIAVNDDEFFENDLLDDEYEYNRDEVIKKVLLLPISDNAKIWITENLPEYPISY